MKTTVIIPNYNGIDYLENCLRSLESSFTDKAPAFEVCIVDNGSVDGSPEMAEQLFPWTQIIRFPENRGFCAAINEGITRARTPYVFLLNNDTTVDPACIRRLERRMDNDPRLFSAAAKMLSMKNPDIMDGAGDRYNALGWAFAIGKGRPSTDYNTPMLIFSASAGAALYRKEYLQKPASSTNSTSPTWKTSTWATAPASSATATPTSPPPKCTTPEAPPPAPATTPSK